MQYIFEKIQEKRFLFQRFDCKLTLNFLSLLALIHEFIKLRINFS